MSSDCTATIRLDPTVAEHRAALAAALPPSTSAAPSSQSYPPPGEVAVTLSTKSSVADDPPWPVAKVCLAAVWDDPMRHVVLVLPEGKSCVSARGPTPSIALQRAGRAFDTAVPEMVHAVEVRMAELATGLASCRLTATAPVTKLRVKVGEREIGPFEGNDFSLACLPSQPLQLTYEVHGERFDHTVSPAMCVSPVALRVPERVPAPPSPGSSEVKHDPPPRDSSTEIAWAVGLGLAVLAAVAVAVSRIIGRRRRVAAHTHRYVEFDLDIGEAAGGGYPVRVVRSPAGEAQTTAHPPELEVELERSLGQGRDLEPVASGAGERQTAMAFGQGLFEAVFSGPVRTLFDTTRAQARLSDTGVRIKLRVRAPELARLPWELLYDAHEPGFLGLSRTTPLSRYLELAQPIKKLAVRPPLRVLGVISTPADAPPLRAELERILIDDAVAELRRDGLFEVHWLAEAEATLQQLQDHLQDAKPWHVLHFIGHGGFDATRQQGRLAFTSANGTRWVSGEELGMLVRDHPSLRLVVLNCCRGAEASTSTLFASTAAQIARTGVPAVVAMQRAITDAAAIAFAQQFYQSLARGLPIEAAVTEGRKAMTLHASDASDVEWSLPVVHLRSPDGQLFELSPERRAVP